MTTPGAEGVLVAVAHGSADPRAAAAITDLMTVVAERAARRGVDIPDLRTAYLSHALPSLPQVISGIDPGAQVTVLPLLLTAAYHSKTDIPRVLANVRREYPRLRVTYGAPLGPHPLLIRALERRLAETDPDVLGAPARTGVVLAAAGSSDPDANAAIARLAARWQALAGWFAVRPAYASATFPDPAAAVTSLLRDGARRAVVATYLLAPGYFADRIRDSSLAAGAAAVSPVLGASAEVADVLLDRFRSRTTSPSPAIAAAPGRPDARAYRSFNLGLRLPGDAATRQEGGGPTMVSAERRAGPAGFNAVDTSADPGGLIRLLDAATTTTGLTAAKQALLEQLALGRARAALDVGCGPGIDLAEMARLMPDGAQVSGVDISETMVAEARFRAASLGLRVSLRTGDAADLSYPDQAFDACRVATVLQHVPDPARVIQEMARVTRPGGRVGVLEFDQETVFVDHPDTETTRIILDTFASAMVQGRMGRQLPRLLRAAGLTDVTVTPWVNLGPPQFFRDILHDHVACLQDEGILTSQRASQWWTELDAWARAGDFLGGAVLFVATATRPV